MLWTKFADQAAIATGNFSRLFGKLEVAPISPLAMRLLELSNQAEVEISEVAKLISSDPGVTAKILRTVNSSFFGLSHQVADVQQGITLLGINRVTSLVLAFSAAQVLPVKAAGFDPVEFWQDSVRRALFASALCGRIARGNEGEAFTGGLLQNIALPILRVKWVKHYMPVVSAAEETGKDLHLIEDEMLSWNHAQAGAWMARNWGFPDVLVCCIGLHHSHLVDLESMNLIATPVAAVAASSRIPDAEEMCCQQLQLPAEAYRQICDETDSACGELASLFSVPLSK